MKIPSRAVLFPASVSALSRPGLRLLAVMVCAVLAITAPLAAQASDKAPADASEESDSPPEIPDTVVVPDPISLTIVLRKTGTIRQIVLNVWLEGQEKSSVAVIERSLPKVLNAFLIDLQRLMYRDTQQRFETRPAGKRSFVYDGPPLLSPPAPKTGDELAAEADEAEATVEEEGKAVRKPSFTPFAPATNRYFAALQNKLLRTAQGLLPPDTIRSVQIRKFYDHWPGDKKTR